MTVGGELNRFSFRWSTSSQNFLCTLFVLLVLLPFVLFIQSDFVSFLFTQKYSCINTRQSHTQDLSFRLYFHLYIFSTYPVHTFSKHIYLCACTFLSLSFSCCELHVSSGSVKVYILWLRKERQKKTDPDDFDLNFIWRFQLSES